MDDIDIAEIEQLLLSDGSPNALAAVWIIHRLQQLQEELDETRFQLNGIEAKINNLHEFKFGT